MTARAVNGNDPTVTDRADVRRRMRVVRDAGETPSAAGSAVKSAYTRAIPRDGDVHPVAEPSKVRNFVSLHGGEARATFVTSWPLNERPSSLAEVAGRVIPSRAQWRAGKALWLAALLIGLFQLAAFTLLWLAALSVDGRKRAAVTLAVLLVATSVYLVSRATAG